MLGCDCNSCNYWIISTCFTLIFYSDIRVAPHRVGGGGGSNDIAITTTLIRLIRMNIKTFRASCCRVSPRFNAIVPCDRPHLASSLGHKRANASFYQFYLRNHALFALIFYALYNLWDLICLKFVFALTPHTLSNIALITIDMLRVISFYFKLHLCLLLITLFPDVCT